MAKNKYLVQQLSSLISGDVETSRQVISLYSHDASLFEVRPDAVTFPKDSADISRLVEYVVSQKASHPELSLTARCGGSDMGGGAINDSIILAFGRYFNHIGAIKDNQVSVQPGAYYRDFEPYALAEGLLMPSYPASKEICMIGGMVANTAGGEKSLIYGKTDRYVASLKVVLRDGKEYVMKPLARHELDQKLAQHDLEGRIYNEMFKLVKNHQATLKASKPKVSKNSTGYNLWDVWDGKKFDLSKVIVGSQGTLGLITEVTFKLVPAKPLSGMQVAFLPSLDRLGEIINSLLKLQPTSLESFDDHTLKFAFRFFLSFRKTLGWKRFIWLGLSFIPVLGRLLKHIFHLPKVILLIEFEGESQAQIDSKLSSAAKHLATFGIDSQVAKDRRQEEKFWIMRRESFNLLRKNVKRKHTAPFIDDLIVPPATLPEFLPRLIEILERYRLLYTIAGHIGDGNFHIIPLMDLADKGERAKIPLVLNEVTALVLQYGGSLSGEHNDGLIRGPFLPQMYSLAMMQLFKQVKEVFDPQNIFNPHKKVTATWEYSEAHMRKRF